MTYPASLRSPAIQYDPEAMAAICIDDAVIAAFEAAIQPYEPPQDLISGSSARGLGDAIQEFVTALGQLNIDRLTRQYSWFARLIGRDLQERIEFDLAAHGLGDKMKALNIAAARARRTMALLEDQRPVMQAIQQNHEELIIEGEAVLASKDPEDFHVARMQRRLVNLEALTAAGRMTQAQVDLAISGLCAMLDRFSEIEKLLFPLWQQHALAIAQSTSGSQGERDSIARFKSAHEQLATHLSAEGTPES